MSDVVLTEVRDRVLVVTLNRPASMNAFDTPLTQGLLAALDRLDGARDLRAGVITGAGRAFSAGMDLKAFAAEGPPRGFRTLVERGSSKPLVAAIEGVALGGGLEVALTCDLVVAARDARLGVPETTVGLFPAGGALWRLPWRIPFGVAAEMVLTGDPITAERAEAVGLVARLTDQGASVDVAVDLALRIARNAPAAIAASRQLLAAAQGATEQELWELQKPLATAVFTSADAKEGASAFAARPRSARTEA